MSHLLARIRNEQSSGECSSDSSGFGHLRRLEEETMEDAAFISGTQGSISCH
jgi:hypothetical protein